ncbi:hypothetical protein HCN_1296 [Helicobacter cinaedi PAGU611]|uniref:hypothetical protein n=1 Tax=Helicobacter cinaedi TaxID=213 RepID=UPI00025D359A|nr:hypothetical protein [Helicobacter cinaedi]BAM12506.1 hypothetical protein HCN_1296 [Helicobacter cinaedi PAGU611]BBB20191.1 hypothetical protein HC081234_13680 [Helicobacter cinaedi]
MKNLLGLGVFWAAIVGLGIVIGYYSWEYNALWLGYNCLVSLQLPSSFTEWYGVVKLLFLLCVIVLFLILICVLSIQHSLKKSK